MKPGVTFVLPCLNEEATLGNVLTTIQSVRDGALADRPTEIVVSDNGSEDRSREIAREHGARVVECAERGYGAALQGGIAAAENEYVIFADCDETYDFSESPALVERADEGFDLVVGSRLAGTIEPGAMPWAHRYLGTPVLTFLINFLFGGRGRRISDCNSGFRCFRRSAFQSWRVESTGMEFASLMLVRAMQSDTRIAEVPITLRPDREDRVPHLRTWRDGMRHLLVILAESPRTFFRAGLVLWALSWAALVTGLVAPEQELAGATVFGLHTMMFALIGSCLGLNIFGTGMLLALRLGPDAGPYRKLLEMDEGKLFWLVLVSLTVILGAAFVPIFMAWAASGFAFLALERPTLVVAAAAANGAFFLFNLVAAHLLRSQA